MFFSKVIAPNFENGHSTSFFNIYLYILFNDSNPIWKPQITLHGKQVAPKPTGTNKIWIGDTITINNAVDLTGMTNGDFRINELNVAVSSAGDELITPVLERV